MKLLLLFLKIVPVLFFQADLATEELKVWFVPAAMQELTSFLILEFVLVCRLLLLNLQEAFLVMQMLTHASLMKCVSILLLTL